jgi:hypothetical protein
MKRLVGAMAAVGLGVAAIAAAQRPAGAAAPTRPGVVVDPLATGAGCITQSTFGTETGNPGNFEVVVQQGTDLVHYWHGNSSPARAWQRSQVITAAATGPGCIIQSRVGTDAGRPGNLEVVVPEGDHVAHYTHDSTQPLSPWVRTATFGTGVTGPPAIVQSDVPTRATGNYEVVVPEHGALVHYRRDNRTAGQPWTRLGVVTTEVTSGASIIQSDLHRALEVVVAEGDHVAHLWLDGADAARPWTRGPSFATGVTGAPAMVQNNAMLNGQRSFEVIVPRGDRLVHWSHDNRSRTGPWREWATVATGVASSASFIQGSIGANGGNFELVALGGPADPPPGGARVRGGAADHPLVHWFHANASPTTPWTRAQDITYRGRSEKVCQLTSSLDRQTGLVPTNDTTNRFGLSSTDLGYPVDDGTTLRMYFGDSRDRLGMGALSERGIDDAVGISTDTVPPSYGQCLRMTVPSSMGRFTRLDVAERNPVTDPFYQGVFNVPASGFRVGGTGYTIFVTDHCALLDAAGRCRNDLLFTSAPGTSEDGRSVLTRNTSETAFRPVLSFPAPFNTATAALDAGPDSGLEADRQGVYVWAVNRYRAGVPRLAFVPAGAVENPAAWRYFDGVDGQGQPRWASAPTNVTAFPDTDPDHCIGEMHVSRVAPLDRWLMLYNCAGADGRSVVKARLAEKPWGPWSTPTEIFAPDADGATCRFIHRPGSPACDALGGDNGDDPGDPYGPYVLTRFTRPRDGGAEITFLLSTWNPYQVVVMRTVLTAGS